MDQIEADYLVVGAGAVGLAFADTLLSETRATIAIVDRLHRPGGHWNHAYPFVRLHQPSATYGVNSRPLGSGRLDDHPLNKGMHELASAAEIISYYEGLMRETFLPSGRVYYFPMSSYEDAAVVSRLSGRRLPVHARKVVDATLNNTSVPSRQPPAYAVAPNMICIPPNALPELASADSHYVIIGAGKTGMDVACWLLDGGADPASIRWIVPRDSWVLDRANFQLGPQFLARFKQAGQEQISALIGATSVPDLFARLEACGQLRRIDPSVMPTAYHCATLSDGELQQLRRLDGVVRLGRVSAIETDHIQLEHGSIPTDPSVIHVNCSAAGIPPLPDRPVFDGDRINLLWVRQCQPVFSAAFIAHIEAAYTDEAEKNRLCGPIPSPQEPLDWLRMLALDLANRRRWSSEPGLRDWIANARLDGFAGQQRSLRADDAPARGGGDDRRGLMAAAEQRVAELLAQAR